MARVSHRYSRLEQDEKAAQLAESRRDSQQAPVIVPAPAQAGPRRGGWQERNFWAWRSFFMYKDSPDFAECLEISFRGAAWLVLWGTPIIWGLDKDPESFFQGNLFQTGAIVSFVYTLAPTVGLTISHAVHGISGTLTAAAFSLLMYMAYPDGCSGAEMFEFCYFFGAVAGAASIACCLLLNLGHSFQVFYCANFVWFWMAFMDPGSPLRTDGHSPKERFFGFEFVDWGGGVYVGVIKFLTGAFLAVIVTVLPYPMTSIEQARDSAFATVSVLNETWTHLVDFYLADDRDETHYASMVSSMRTSNNHISTLKEHLAASWWEMYFLSFCGRSWRSKQLYLTELEATSTRCLARLTHVVDACLREKFEDIHDEMMKPERCGDAVRVLVRSAFDLLRLALERADDGNISAAEMEELLRKADGLKTKVFHLSRQTRQSIVYFVETEARKDPGMSTEEVLKQLADEQIFMFSLCDFASSVEAYSRWLAMQHDAPPQQISDRVFDWAAGLQKVFDKDTIMAHANVNHALRGCLSIFIGFSIGYVGYSAMIPAKDATIPGTIAVLLSPSLTSPISKSLARLQGVVLGRFSGQLAYALLGSCSAWAQMSLSAIVFSYVWLTLFISHYTSPFSYLGCLAAAFGTQAFLVGCDDSVVHPKAGFIVKILVAIVLMTVIDLALKLGRPSELAFAVYLDAWAAWDCVLGALINGEHIGMEPLQIKTLINQAQSFADEAKSEPRFWRAPFPADLFSQMISFARTMRTHVICIRTVVSDQKQNGDGTFSKKEKEWFKRLREDPLSGWPAGISRVLGELDTTYGMVENVEKMNGTNRPKSIFKIRRDNSNVRRMGSIKLCTSGVTTDRIKEEARAETLSLVEDELAQRNFVYGCLQSIQAANSDMQLEMFKSGHQTCGRAGRPETSLAPEMEIDA